MKTLIALLSVFLLSQSAIAQETGGDGLDRRAAEDLTRFFRASRPGAVMPVGPLYKAFFGHAWVASEAPPVCGMQVLVLYERPDIEMTRSLNLTTRYRFVGRNNGEASQLSRDALANRCLLESVDATWFYAPEGQEPEAFFAAWTALGALGAVAAGRNAYADVAIRHLEDAVDRGPRVGPSTREFARTSADTLSRVTLVRGAGDQPVAGIITFDAGRGLGGCSLDVEVTFTERGDGQGLAVDRRVTALEVGRVSCYVV